jgi:hypothetical protein
MHLIAAPRNQQIKQTLKHFPPFFFSIEIAR